MCLTWIKISWKFMLKESKDGSRMGSLNGTEWELDQFCMLAAWSPMLRVSVTSFLSSLGTSTHQIRLLKSSMGPVQEPCVYTILDPNVRGSHWLIEAGPGTEAAVTNEVRKMWPQNPSFHGKLMPVGNLWASASITSSLCNRYSWTVRLGLLKQPWVDCRFIPSLHLPPTNTSPPFTKLN